MLCPDGAGDPRHRANDLHTDRRHLTATAYATGVHLSARQAIYRFLEPRLDLFEWMMAQVQWQGNERVMDAGCGNGSYLRWLAREPDRQGKSVGFDLSAGMVREVRHTWIPNLPLPSLLVADIQSIPLSTASVDVALAMHMLYHVPDVGRAIHELRRIVRPGGVLLAATNGDRDKDALWEVLGAAQAAVTGGGRAFVSKPDYSFSLENGGDRLRTAFQHVERRDLTQMLVVTEARAIVDYIASMTSVRSEALRIGADWPAVLAEVERRVTAAIDFDGAFRIRTHVGVFVCS